MFKKFFTWIRTKIWSCIGWAKGIYEVFVKSFIKRIYLFIMGWANSGLSTKPIV